MQAPERGEPRRAQPSPTLRPLPRTARQSGSKGRGAGSASKRSEHGDRSTARPESEGPRSRCGARGRTPGVPHPIPPHDGQRRATARTRGESGDQRGEQPPAAPGAGRGSGSLGPQADKVRAQRLLRTRPGALEKPEGQQPADKGKPRWVTPSGAGHPASMGSGSSFHTPPPSGRK